MAKFRVGDKVKLNETAPRRKGDIGTIFEKADTVFDWRVKFDGGDVIALYESEMTPALRFKVGDKVRIVASGDGWFSGHENETAVVLSLRGDQCEHDYLIKFDAGGREDCANDAELEPIAPPAYSVGDRVKVRQPWGAVRTGVVYVHSGGYYDGKTCVKYDDSKTSGFDVMKDVEVIEVIAPAKPVAQAPEAPEAPKRKPVVGDKVRLIGYKPDYHGAYRCISKFPVGTTGTVVSTRENAHYDAYVRFENVDQPMFASNEGWGVKSGEYEIVDEAPKPSLLPIGTKVRLTAKGLAEASEKAWYNYECTNASTVGEIIRNDVSDVMYSPYFVKFATGTTWYVRPEYIEPVAAKREFRVGDKVRTSAKYPQFVKTDHNDHPSITVGSVGEVTKVSDDAHEKLPYRVRMDTPDAPHFYYREEALELANAPTPNIEGVFALLEEVAKKCGGYEFQRVREAATFIEKRLGTNDAIEYLRSIVA